MSTFQLCLTVILIGGILSAAIQLPGGIKPCKVDETLDKCVLEEAKTVIPNIVKGDKKFKIPVLDPLKIDRIEVSHGNDKSSFINMTLFNLKVTGLKGAKMTKSEIDQKKMNAKWTFAIKPLHLISDYEISGKFLLVPIIGKGKCTITVDEGIFVYSVDYSVEKKDGVEYLGVGKPHLEYDVTRVRFNFENLFNGNKPLGDSVNQLLNDNWVEINKQVGPALSEAIITILTNVVVKLTSHVPYKELFIIE